ncbi:MAG: SRPBCC family protein [Woeseia sp.]
MATLLLVLYPPLPAGAEVVDAEATGFTTRHSVTISRPRAEVYRAAAGQVGSWWSDDYTVSGHASNLYIEAQTQGCFCERLGERAGVVHMTVTFVNPTVMLRLTGGLGPLGLLGVSGNMTWEFTDSADGTTVTWSYAVGGYLPGGLEQMAEAVDGVLIHQMNRLKEFAES